MNNIVFFSFIVALVVSASAIADPKEYESVNGSPHDLAANPAIAGGFGTCAWCHVMDEASGKVHAALNRGEPASEITLYRNDRLSTKVSELSGVSSHCMTCHDGETPFDAIGGAIGTKANNMNTLYPGSAAIIGTDLNNHHPVGVANPAGIYFNDPAVIAQSGLWLYDGKVECTTCHDVHGGAGFGKFLVKDNRASALCLDCHNK